MHPLAVGIQFFGSMPQPMIETERLILRPFRLSDAQVVQSLAGVRDIADTTMSIPHPYEDGMAEEWIGGRDLAFKDGKAITFAMVLCDDGSVIGAAGLEIDRGCDKAELGYWVGKPFWNRGYATEAAAALLAYGFDLENEGLRELASANNAQLAGSSDEAIRLLASLGHPVSFEDYARYSWDRRRGGWKGLNYLIDLGICKDVHEYFRIFDEIGHPQAEFPLVEEVVNCVHQASGVVVLAHPGANFYNGVDIERLDLLVEMGVGGLECFSFHHDEATTRGFLQYCRSRNLLVTGGSDCHGGFAGRAIGVPPVSAGDLRLGRLEDSVLG